MALAVNHVGMLKVVLMLKEMYYQISKFVCKKIGLVQNPLNKKRLEIGRRLKFV